MDCCVERRNFSKLRWEKGSGGWFVASAAGKDAIPNAKNGQGPADLGGEAVVASKLRNGDPTQAIQENWGSCCPSREKVTCANNASYPIKGVGKILITISDGSDLCLPDVLYVPGIKKNLLSVSSLAKNGLRVIFEDDICIVRDRENGYSLITTGTLENGLFVLDRYEKQIQACIAKTKTQAMQDAELWHARFGHVGYGSLMTLQRHNMVHDLSLLEMPPRHVAKYTLRTDRGGEYMSGAFKDFLGKKGIKHQCTMPYTPQQNGVAERKNRSLMEMARCMLKAKSLPHKRWMEAVACAAHVLNRCPTRAFKTITPYESCYDRKPSVSYLHVFGCLAYAHIPQQLRGKLDDKTFKCIFVGYSSASKVIDFTILL
ncbi:hypothetical protein L7F22_048785 [Adiantum nelumboides]|nr:hypothetical protein [Adiantum nelumboides]